MQSQEHFIPAVDASYNDEYPANGILGQPRPVCRVPFLAAVDAPNQSVLDVDWSRAAIVDVAQFHAASSTHHPRTIVRIAHHHHAIHLRYSVADHYLVSRQTENQRQVCEDSCVEFFVQPRPDCGYFNFEFNCCGTMLCHYIEDCRRTATGFVRHRPLSAADLSHVRVRSSLPPTVWPECPYPINWQLDVLIGLEAMEPYVGAIRSLSGRTFAANFFKCADKSSHPHWGSWAPIGEELNFHQPRTFGVLEFE